MPYIEEEGIFRGTNTGQDIVESQSSKAVALALRFTATEMLDRGTNEWRQLAAPHHVRGRFYIIKADGTISSKIVEDLIAIGWDSSIAGVASSPEVNRPCQFVVKAQDPVPGKDGSSRTFYNAEFVKPFDFTPDGGGDKYAADETRATALDRQFGSQLRALKGAAPKPFAKPGPEPESAPEPEPEQADEAEGFGSVPF